MHTDALLFLTGSCAYPTLEMIWRGKTHYSMALAGGFCLYLINKVCCERLKEKSIPLRCCAGAGIITSVELATGYIFNHLLRFQVWDYSNMPLNLFGQICLPYSFLWIFLTLPAMALCEIFKKHPFLQFEENH